MKLLEEVKKGIVAHYATTTLATVDHIPLYQDHIPNAITYPFIVFFHKSSNNKYAMIDASTHPTGYDYLMPAIFQFSVYANDRQYSQMEDIADRLEDAFNKVHMTFGAGCTHIGTLVSDDRTKFFEQNQKIWVIHQDYRIWCGK